MLVITLEDKVTADYTKYLSQTFYILNQHIIDELWKSEIAFYDNWERFSLEYARLLREAELLVCNSVISFTGIYLTCSLLLLNTFLMACCQKCQNTHKVAPSFDTLCTVACLLDLSEASSKSLTQGQGSSALMWGKCKLLLPEWAPSAPHLTLRVISQLRAQNANWFRFLQSLYLGATSDPKSQMQQIPGPWLWRFEVGSSGLSPFYRSGVLCPLCQQHGGNGVTCSCLGDVSTSQVLLL